MRALITGVSGFCGAHLVSRLRRESDIEIAGFDRIARPSQISLDRYFQGDITETGAVDSAISELRPDFLFHLAGVSGHAAPAPCIYAVNVMGTVHVLEAVRQHVPASKVLMIGSFAEYGPAGASAMPLTEESICRPLGAYGITKYAATLIGLDYARTFGIKVIVVRPSNIIGPGVPPSLVVGALLSRAKQALASAQPLVKIGDFDSERDFIDAGDAVDAYVRLARSEAHGEIFNVCSGRAYSIRHVAETLLANSSRPITLECDPNLFPPSPVRSLYGSYEKAGRAIGFRPSTTLEESLKAAWRAEIEAGVPCA